MKHPALDGISGTPSQRVSTKPVERGDDADRGIRGGGVSFRDNAPDCSLIFAPRDAFLALLADGWRFCNDIAEPMAGSHGEYATMMEREL